MLSNIPSWAVSVAGAALVAVATAISFILLHDVRDEIAASQERITNLEERIENAWQNHRLGDRRVTSAEIFIADALGGGANSSFVLGQAAYNLRGAILAMYSAAGQNVPDQRPARIKKLEESLRRGNLGAYTKLSSEVEQLRRASQAHINGLSKRIDQEEARQRGLNTTEENVYLIYVALNLIGLMMVMMKDLPVWKDTKRTGGAT